jgi:hypothetical protein
MYMNKSFRYESKKVSYNGVVGQIAVRYTENGDEKEYDSLYEYRQMVDFKRDKKMGRIGA